MTTRSLEPPAPHRQTQMKNKKSDYQSLIPTEAATMDASRPELDLVHFDGVSKPESETSSIQIITDRRPSCWSIASPPKAPPTEWNSASVNIDRPITTRLPIYRFPKPEHKTGREIAPSPSNRQQAKLNPQTTRSASVAPKDYKIDGSPSSPTSGKDELRSAARVASQDLLHHQFQETQHDEQRNVEQALRLKAFHDDGFSGSVQASLNVQPESDELKTSFSTKDTPQAELLSAKKSSIVSSALSPQAEIDQESMPLRKQNGVVPPHLRMQSARPSDKTKALPPHLLHSASPSTTKAINTNAQEEDPDRERLMKSVTQGEKLLPHLRGLSTTNSRATKAPSSVTMSLPTNPRNDDNYRQIINMDEDIANVQPLLDIDEEIVAGLRADAADATTVAQPTDESAQETDEQIVYVPPHVGASISRSKASAVEGKSNTNMATRSHVNQYGASPQGTKTIANDSTSVPCASTSQDSSTKRKNADSVCTPKNSVIRDRAESSVKKGKKPAKEFGSVDFSSKLVGWDGKMNQPPVGDEWDRRQPFNPQRQERLSVIEAWRTEHAADPEENNRVVVNTSILDFQTGEGLAGGDVNVLSPINKMDHETRAPNDDFTQARRNQNAAEAIKDYEAKMAAKPKIVLPGIEGLTKEEKRNLRRALMETERTIKTLPNPHAPAANIYLRPAEFKDMAQVTRMYNHYISQSTFVLELDPVGELHWYVYFLGMIP